MLTPVNHLVDGEPVDVVSVTNRGLAYGDGVFETIFFRGMNPVLWEQHCDRLVLACEKLALNLPLDARQLLLDQCHRLLELNPRTSSVLKIIVTRSSSERGYRSAPDSGIQTIVSVYPAPELATENHSRGVNLWLCNTRLSVNPQFAGIKHLNRLEQVMAAREWPRTGFQEGLMLDPDNYVIEGTRSNIFFEMDNQLVTPALDKAGVAGVLRGIVLQQAAQLGLGATIGSVSIEQMERMDAAFICNSVFGIWPVRSVRLSATKMLNWQPGPLTRRVQDYIADSLSLGVSRQPVSK